MTSRVAILGAGHAGRALAGHMALLGAEVVLWNRTAAHVAEIRERAGVELEGEAVGFAKLSLVTSDMAEALADAKLVMVCVPAFGHRDVARECAPHLRDGHVVVLNPGRTFGALEFIHELRAQECEADVVVAEAGTFIFASRSTGPAQSRIMRIKHAVPVAAIPDDRGVEVMELLGTWYHQFTLSESTLDTSFGNVGAVVHPVITLLNAARIENTQGRFDFYVDGVSIGVAHVLEAVDRERMAVAQLLGVQVRSLKDWLLSAYRAGGEDLYEAIMANEGYRGIQAPPTTQNRYMLEDIPMSMVPMASAGRGFGLTPRAIEAVIDLSGLMHLTNYWSRGRTLATLGLEGLSPAEIKRVATKGYDG
ncbi:MAG: NAD/NADP octopine/nopaline dehydrogenase family protein [Acidimicrobiales bacterium]|nr:NAD/NADP octopine/nopaline dehydrogenase family protein [Acidimicrobiales bacterium]HLV90023.1 NAD/NADP octopine/nopaline dehydrogenase family protein [Acidimicrobiia bacterium]